MLECNNYKECKKCRWIQAWKCFFIRQLNRFFFLEIWLKFSQVFVNQVSVFFHFRFVGSTAPGVPWKLPITVNFRKLFIASISSRAKFDPPDVEINCGGGKQVYSILLVYCSFCTYCAEVCLWTSKTLKNIRRRIHKYTLEKLRWKDAQNDVQDEFLRLRLVCAGSVCIIRICQTERMKNNGWLGDLECKYQKMWSFIQIWFECDNLDEFLNIWIKSEWNWNETPNR